MAPEEGGKTKPRGKKGFLSAVYVNRFGRHLSGAVIRFVDNEAKEQQEQDIMCSPEGSICPPTHTTRLDVGLKNRRVVKKATFTPPKRMKQAELPLVHTHASLETAENSDVFKFPLPANSDAAKSKNKKKKSVFGKNCEAFRVIYKMLQENENLRSRLLANSQKNTLVPGEQTTLERQNSLPKALDPSPFGWV